MARQRADLNDPLSLMLSLEDDAVAVAFRRHTLLPLDNCVYALQVTIPRLTRSSRIAACSAVSIS
jgi:hypothetical protein